MAKRGKKYKEAASKIDREKLYSYEEGIALAKELSFTKFDETLSVSAKLNLAKSESVRDTLVLPHQFSDEKRILVFARGDKAEEAKEAGATYVGDDDLIAKIKDGWLDFDICVATPDMMRDVGKLGPVLGRRGLMPNPKTRTVTNDVKAALSELRQGRVEFRAEKGGVVHLAVGKVSMEVSQIKENAEIFLNSLAKKVPQDHKGIFIKTVAISTTMGPGIRLNSDSDQ